MRCVSSVRFNMLATVLNDYSSDASTDVDTEIKGGHWESYQDEDTGALERRWVEDAVVPSVVDRGTTTVMNSNRFNIECYVRGFDAVGFRSSANTEFFAAGRYLPFEVVNFVYPVKYILNRGQFVTNIRGRDKKILWLEEETGLPTVFEVQGATPRFDPFGRPVDNLAVLRRAAIQ